MDEPLRLGFGPYSLNPYANPNQNFKLNVSQPNNYKYSCKREQLKPFAKCVGSFTVWLLAPAGIGIIERHC
ncbi:hypothetical protein [Desulfosporosinus sp. Sb-LF]|uniref:hypothetical protein n=1 Tax=Desulfosporosinus sp. Sb-LF TaxID=2560027 RepID=UPI00107F6C3F|nr:hypothetical protein [Desulfosporosinus sp. Sb-LF]TGE31193.1 hypothetical protein E4K68_18325 [Desulfosporosinus sp. Sb-LF]